MGDTPDIDYSDRPFFKLGGQRVINRRVSLGAQWYYKQASRPDRDNVRTLGVYLQSRIKRDLTFSVYFSKGLSDVTTDTAISGVLSKGF